jgi:alkyl hydroperoxide reductase subunit AhpF
MSLLDQQTREQIGELFEQLDAPVDLIFFTRRPSPLVLPGRSEEDCPSCADEEQLLGELAELSDKLSLEVHELGSEPPAAEADGIERVPALVVRSAETPGRIRFFGLPAGYEFSTLIADIVDVSRGNVELSAKTQSQLAALEDDVHIQVFVTPI